MTEAQDRLIDLLVQYDEAIRAEDWQRVDTLNTQIEAARADRDAIRRKLGL
ncbi:MAG TPA: hypothetical protein VET89_06960 [Stellaceae bacterium]|nr:hypothetical protein [Stellaceae bacterium]